jgi:hypothetical protein
MVAEHSIASGSRQRLARRGIPCPRGPRARPRRFLFMLALSLLLVWTQQASGLHALEHIREALSHTQDHSLSVPGDEVCAMCALFAGSASALAGDMDHSYDALATDEAPQPASVSFAPAAPSYYQSRAPPPLL